MYGDDMLVIKKRPVTAGGYRPIMVSNETYDKITKIKEETGVSYKDLIACMIDFALAHVRIEESDETPPWE